MGDADLKNIRKKIWIIDKKRLTLIGSGMNFLISNPRICELLVFTDSMLESANLKLNRHRSVWIKLIVPLDQFLDTCKEILSLGEGAYV